MYTVEGDQTGKERTEGEEVSSHQNSGGVAAHLKGKANSSVLRFAEGQKSIVREGWWEEIYYIIA